MRPRVGQVRRHNDGVGIYLILDGDGRRLAAWRVLILESEYSFDEEEGASARILESWLVEHTVAEW